MPIGSVHHIIDDTQFVERKINRHHIIFAAAAEFLLSCWRHSNFLIEQVEGKDIKIPCEEYHANILRSNNNNSNNNTPADNDGIVDIQNNELCLVISILISFHPDSLATTNRWKRTFIHSLFESKCMGRAGEKGLRETLLGIWGSHGISKEMYKEMFHSYTHSIHRIPMSTNSRDYKGRLLMHCAAESQWENIRQCCDLW